MDNTLTTAEKNGKKEISAKISSTKWFAPILTALRQLGGEGTPRDVYQKIVKNEHLTAEEIRKVRGKTKVKKFNNDVAFAKIYLTWGGYIDKQERGVWRLTEAGKKIDMTNEAAQKLFREYLAARRTKKAFPDEEQNNAIRYWIYAPGHNADKWDEFYQKGVMAIGWGEVGDLRGFESKNKIKQKMWEVYGDTSSYTNSVLALWQFAHEMRPGDIVFVKKGRSMIIGRGIVESDYEYDTAQNEDYYHVRKVRWTDKGAWPATVTIALKTLTDITPYTDDVEQIKNLLGDESLPPPSVSPLYTDKDFLQDVFIQDVFISEDEYSDLTSLVENEKNVILLGPPGVGKTFAAKRLAYAMMGEKDRERVMMVQFHQSYSYEDFIMGYRPTPSGFELHRGAFYNFCKKAADDSDNMYFFIIDEINRGNISKIFGELFMLIENDKRGLELRLMYSDERFFVPENLYLIGMMNTADRSLAMIDYALRRRFAFFELKPGFDSDGFRSYQNALESDSFDRLIACVKNLNEKICSDDSLGVGFCIGHSYFCGLDPETVDERLYAIVEYKLLPLLNEYWFDEPLEVQKWSERLRGALR